MVVNATMFVSGKSFEVFAMGSSVPISGSTGYLISNLFPCRERRVSDKKKPAETARSRRWFSKGLTLMGRKKKG